ncbi:hypothetical protein NIES806_23460 [Dolichospermum compactum NIES-806]|uniref:Uncharacterized protein n=1 Tax=Dolichospermum compactum NIES-806 TaxID=1973481 RepID=A0A1Z4V3N5_9CYAN|nr:hypothetical protein NIES806_23460 [Dolichospermum compactum NIES-806]
MAAGGGDMEAIKAIRELPLNNQLSRQEIEAMFLVSDIKQIKVYQEAKQEEATTLLMRLLSK